MSIGGLVAGKALDLAVDHALDGAIGVAIAKASKYRSQRFIEALINAVRLELDHDVSEDELNELLAKLANKTNSEAVFDSCRRACLSRSKEIGPRVIALLTAVLLSEERGPNDEEKMILDVAERLNDGELEEVVATIRQWEQELLDQSPKMQQRYGELHMKVDQVDLDDRHQGVVETGSRLIAVLGALGERLRSCGLVDEYMEQSRIHWRADSERYIDEDGSATRTIWIIVFKVGYRSLADYIERAQRAIVASTLE